MIKTGGGKDPITLTAEMECLRWAFRQLKPEERDYLAKRVKRVAGKRTLKGSWYEKDLMLLKLLVSMREWQPGVFNGLLLPVVDTDKMRAEVYPGLPDDKTPEAYYRLLSDTYRNAGPEADARESGKKATQDFLLSLDGLAYDRRAFGFLIIYIIAYGQGLRAARFLLQTIGTFEFAGGTDTLLQCTPELFAEIPPDEAPEEQESDDEASSDEEASAEVEEAEPASEEEAGPAEEASEAADAKAPAEKPAEPEIREESLPKRAPSALAKPRTVFPRAFKLDIPPVTRGATRYLGYIRTSGGSFFNFYAVAEWYKDRFGTLEAEAKRLFPTYGAFNLKSASRTQLKEGAFYVIDLMPSEVMPNYDENGIERADFHKCVDFSKLTSTKRFFSASDFGIHFVVKPVEDFDRVDFTSPMIPVHVTESPEYEDEVKVSNELVLLEHKDFFYGPVRLKKDSRGTAYVTFSGTIHKGLASAFRGRSGQVETVRQYVRWEAAGQPVHVGVRYAKTAFMESVSVDVWNDAELVKRLLEKSSMSASEMRELLESPEIFEGVEAEVEEGRLARAKSVLSRMRYKEDVRENVAGFVVDELKTGNAEALEAVVSRVAVDEKLIEVLARQSVVGQKIEALKAMEQTLESNARARKVEQEKLEKQARKLAEDLKNLDAEIQEKGRALGLMDEKKSVLEQLRGLDEALDARREDCRKLETLRTQLVEEAKKICAKAQGAGDGLMPSHLVQAVEAWDEEDVRRRREKLAQAVCDVKPADLKGRGLARELVKAVQEVRRYDENTVLNLYICWVQNFLTVLAGEPGSGKTSICHILARTLGLDAFDELIAPENRAGLSAGRFVHVPVEYGWTTKRDFVGYWNPLTNRFESSDPARWDLLCTLDAEARSAAGSVYPALMLLDEANLSPMEYYWSDWMRLCDEQASSGLVTLWDKSPTAVPETLRFMATINNDSTTETLSPRLIDRAVVVTLPLVDCIENARPARVVGPVAWKELKAYFGPKPVSKNAGELKALQQKLLPALETFGIRLSPRSIRQITGYVGTASSVFADGEKPAWLDAADFAVMQKCLPRIMGTGTRYREKLVELNRSLEGLGLARSACVVTRILHQGDEAMDCYRFF